MVGDGEEADAYTREFCKYWEDNAALSGGVLVYNTGRSLGQFKGLWESKKGDLPLPDVLITAVGTKVTRPVYHQPCWYQAITSRSCLPESTSMTALEQWDEAGSVM